MFIFGHLGIGSKIVSPWTRGLPKRAVFLGCLLPDLIDKPLYYGLSAITGLHGTELGIIDGTRTFGHTALFLIIVTAGSWYKRSLWLAALALGIASHLVLDNFSDALRHDEFRSAMVALVWPLAGMQFAPIPFNSMAAHFGALWAKVTIGAEIIGIGLLSWDGWKLANEHQILATLKRKGGLREALRGFKKDGKKKKRHLRSVR